MDLFGQFRKLDPQDRRRAVFFARTVLILNDGMDSPPPGRYSYTLNAAFEIRHIDPVLDRELGLKGAGVGLGAQAIDRSEAFLLLARAATAILNGEEYVGPYPIPTANGWVIRPHRLTGVFSRGRFLGVWATVELKDTGTTTGKSACNGHPEKP